MEYIPLDYCIYCHGSLKTDLLFDNVFYKHILVYKCASCGRYKMKPLHNLETLSDEE